MRTVSTLVRTMVRYVQFVANNYIKGAHSGVRGDLMPSFNIVHDNELIASGKYFWCTGHLGAVLLDEQSPDSRYCRVCFDLLNGEVRVLKETGHFSKAATWPPKVSKEHVKQPGNTLKTTPENSPRGIPQATVLLPINPMSTKTLAPVAIRPSGKKGGRPKKELPMDKILELHSTGVGMKKIGEQLGFSGMTISRALAAVK